jgi:hypothetical protein
MDAEKLRARAERCRELGRVAVRDDIREQLRQWAEEFDAEADAAERVRQAVTHH